MNLSSIYCFHLMQNTSTENNNKIMVIQLKKTMSKLNRKYWQQLITRRIGHSHG